MQLSFSIMKYTKERIEMLEQLRTCRIPNFKTIDTDMVVVKEDVYKKIVFFCNFASYYFEKLWNFVEQTYNNQEQLLKF